jgi:hypothetical protein
MPLPSGHIARREITRILRPAAKPRQRLPHAHILRLWVGNWPPSAPSYHRKVKPHAAYKGRTRHALRQEKPHLTIKRNLAEHDLWAGVYD